MAWIGVLLGLALAIAPLKGKPSEDTNDGKPIQNAKGEKEYRLIEGEITWDEVGKRCWQLGRGWYPASLLTNEEFDEIAGKMLSGSKCSESWVGLSRDGDLWYWYNGSGDDRKVKSTDNRWASGEPKNEDLANAFIRQESKKVQLISSEAKAKRCVLCDKSLRN